MKFLHLFNKSPTTHDGFANIQGYEDIKDIVLRVLESDENYNLLFVGAPASSKTLFLQGILEIRKDGVYFDGSNINPGCLGRTEAPNNMYRRVRQDASNIPESAFEFHGVWEGQDRPAEEAV
jgi:hypothetical protein